MEDVWEDRGDESVKRPTIIKSPIDLQRLKLEKLMKHPDRPMLIPELPKERGVPVVPEFVRNVMGSSAGAGSGEFHVYRHLRRKEYARQKYMREKGERERLDDEYHIKLDEYKKNAEEKTAKRRAKRLKRKTNPKKKKVSESKVSTESEELSESDCDKSENDHSEQKSQVIEEKVVENTDDKTAIDVES